MMMYAAAATSKMSIPYTTYTSTHPVSRWPVKKKRTEACLWGVHPCLSWKPVSRIGDCDSGWQGGIVPTREPIDHQPRPPTVPSLVSHTTEGTEDIIQRAGVQFRRLNLYQVTPMF